MTRNSSISRQKMRAKQLRFTAASLLLLGAHSLRSLVADGTLKVENNGQVHMSGWMLGNGKGKYRSVGKKDYGFFPWSKGG